MEKTAVQAGAEAGSGTSEQEAASSLRTQERRAQLTERSLCAVLVLLPDLIPGLLNPTEIATRGSGEKASSRVMAK